MAYTWSSSNTLAGQAGHPKFLPSISSPWRRLLQMKMGPGRREAPLSAVRLRIRSSVNVSKPKIDGSCEPSLLLAFYSRRAHGLWSPRFIVSVGPTVRIISVHRLNSSRFALPTRPLYYRPVPPPPTGAVVVGFPAYADVRRSVLPRTRRI